VQHGDAVGERLDIGEQMGGEQEGHTGRPLLLQHALEAHPCAGVEAAHGLVEHEYGALREQTSGQPEHLRHALRIGLHRRLQGFGREAELRAKRIDGPCGELHAIERQHVVDEPTALQVVGRLESLGEIRQALARPAIAVLAARDPDGAGIDTAQVEQATDQGRLTGTVGAHEGDGFAGGNLQIDTGEHITSPEAAANAAQLDDRLIHTAFQGDQGSVNRP
jgi:hypothetical protein